ncbi:hypothetical protein NQ317_013403 [Molorchus minor]|uniref:Uncharacterized protein n=1 Tax=Molorchus minor TaxID=1323400 RepID=A0ABQ9IUR0_9CUCU|nr:hypothetical protein NQ317_013403 [Molorchus minor]
MTKVLQRKRSSGSETEQNECVVIPVYVPGIDCDYSRNDPSHPDLTQTLPKRKTAMFGVFHHIFRSKESIATIPEMIRALPTLSEFSPIFPELSRRLETPCLVRGINCDDSRNDPSPPDLSRTLTKPKTTVFGVFPYIFTYLY